MIVQVIPPFVEFGDLFGVQVLYNVLCCYIIIVVHNEFCMFCYFLMP